MTESNKVHMHLSFSSVPFELKRFAEFRENIDNLYDVQLTDLMMSDEALSKMFAVGGMKWLEAVIKKAAELPVGAIPSRFLNSVNSYWQSGCKFKANLDILSLVVQDFINALDVIAEEESIKHIMDFMVIGEDNKFNHAGMDALHKELTEISTDSTVYVPMLRNLDDKPGYATLIIRADHLSYDVVSSEFLKPN